MAIQVREEAGGKVLVVRVTEKLTREEYEHFRPEADRLISEHGKIRILFDMHDFHGWTMGAMWDDLKFDVKHGKDIERLAMIGEAAWEKGMAAFCKPFTSAKIQYFDRSQEDEAHRWIVEGLPESASR